VRPRFRDAFDVHVGDLADSAYEFLKTNNGTENLKPRLNKYVNLDKRIKKAKEMLMSYVENSEAIRIENILR